MMQTSPATDQQGAARSAVRGGYVPIGSGNSGGFRVVCAPGRD